MRSSTSCVHHPLCANDTFTRVRADLQLVHDPSHDGQAPEAHEIASKRFCLRNSVVVNTDPAVAEQVRQLQSSIGQSHARSEARSGAPGSAESSDADATSASDVGETCHSYVVVNTDSNLSGNVQNFLKNFSTTSTAANDAPVASSVNSSSARPDVPVAVVSRASSFMDVTDPKMSCFSHPLLFPYGTGSPREARRRVKVSFAQAIKHLLKISDRRFANDINFTLLAFSTWCVEEALHAGHVSVRMMSSDQQRHVVELQPERMERFAQWLNNCHTARMAGLPAPERPEDLTGTWTAMMKLRSSAAKLPGTDDARLRNRSQLASYLQFWGAPSIFLTISPDSCTSLICGYDCGAVPLVDLLRAIHEPGKFVFPTRHELLRVVARSPGGQAKSVVRFVNHFISDVVGYDTHCGRAFKHRGGVFGTPRAYFAMTEAQARGTHWPICMMLTGGNPF